MGRQRCSGCERAVRVCLCAELPSPPLRTRTSVVVLQHPHEARHKLSTLPPLSKCLANCHILQGRRFHAGLSPLLDSFFSHHPSPSFHALLLFPSPSAQPIATWFHQFVQDLAASSSPLRAVACPLHSSTSLPPRNIEQGSAPCSTDDSVKICTSRPALKGYLPDQVACCTETLDFNSFQHASMFRSVAHDAHSCSQHIVLIAVDATWRHANEMIKASAPYLDRFVVPVCLPFNANQEGSCMANSELIIRKEPFKGCMTTLEAISCCLKVLEPNGVEIHDKLTHVLRCMVQFQASNIASHKVRMNKQSKCTPIQHTRDMAKYP